MLRDNITKLPSIVFFFFRCYIAKNEKRKKNSSSNFMNNLDELARGACGTKTIFLAAKAIL